MPFAEVLFLLSALILYDLLVEGLIPYLIHSFQTHGCQIAIQAYTRGCDCAEDVRILIFWEDIGLGDETDFRPLLAFDEVGLEGGRVYIKTEMT